MKPYHVAISCLAKDQPLAKKIFEGLPGYNVFLYTENPEEVLARMGSEKFRSIFRNEAMIVVVLYDDQWGNTDWTRIEEWAINDRLLRERDDFLVFHPIRPELKYPDWLPETFIRSSEQYSISELIGIIKDLVRNYGQRDVKETLQSKAVRIVRKNREQSDRLGRIQSESHIAGKREFSELVKAVEKSLKQITESGLDARFKHNSYECKVVVNFFSLLFSLQYTGLSSDPPFITMRFYKGQVALSTESVPLLTELDFS